MKAPLCIRIFSAFVAAIGLLNCPLALAQEPGAAIAVPSLPNQADMGQRQGTAQAASPEAKPLGPPEPEDGAALLAQRVRATMTSGQTYTISLTLQNTGQTTWTAGEGYALGSQNPANNGTWGVARVSPDVAVSPGQSYTFSFRVRAPSAGSYDMQWQVLREGVRWFGSVSSAPVIVVPEGGPAEAVTFVHTDGLGSPVARTDADANLISRTRYEPYGATASGVESSIGFAGHVNDSYIGLVYMQQRYYDPLAGRFVSVDPVVAAANSGESFNRYAYASNSPYKYVDSDGRQERAAEAFSDQFRSDAASGNASVYGPFHSPVVIAALGMAVGPPLAAVVLAGTPAGPTLTVGTIAKATTIVAKNGVEIKSIARHAVARAIGDGGKRAGVGARGILESLKNPLKITDTKTDALGRASQRFIGRDATTAVNPETGKIVSVNPTSTKTAEKLMRTSE